MDKSQKHHLLKNLILISGAICLVISFLLLCNSWCFIQNDPLDHNTFKGLVEHLKVDPQSDELIKEMQDYDLLARKAYFNKPWQLLTGIIILLKGCRTLILTFLRSARIIDETR